MESGGLKAADVWAHCYASWVGLPGLSLIFDIASRSANSRSRGRDCQPSAGIQVSGKSAACQASGLSGVFVSQEVARLQANTMPEPVLQGQTCGSSAPLRSSRRISGSDGD